MAKLGLTRSHDTMAILAHLEAERTQRRQDLEADADPVVTAALRAEIRLLTQLIEAMTPAI